MPTLSDDRIADLLTPYLAHASIPPSLYGRLSIYLDLLLKWNVRTNLTAIRDPEAIVQRHFGESLFTGLTLAPHLTPTATLLDLGSGAGFPGLPIQLLFPHLRVTLAESQNKKATFLREAIRVLGFPTEVWAARAEALPASRLFDVVTLRAVDNMEQALAAAQPRLAPHGILAVLTTAPAENGTAIPLPLPSHGYLTLTEAS